MNYKYLFLLLSTIIFHSCIEEIDITEFTSEFGEFEQEYRIEALMLPDDKTAIIRIDKTISIDESKKTKQIQIKTFNKENELDILFKTIDADSLKLYAEMMRDRYGKNIDD